LAYFGGRARAGLGCQIFVPKLYVLLDEAHNLRGGFA